MLLSMVALGGAILGVTTIAGLLMVYQVRQATDASRSAAAIFAADAGLEWGLYNYYCLTAPAGAYAVCPIANLPVFSNQASVEVSCLEGTTALASCADITPASRVTQIRSVGRAGESSRAFQLDL